MTSSVHEDSFGRLLDTQSGSTLMRGGNPEDQSQDLNRIVLMDLSEAPIDWSQFSL